MEWYDGIMCPAEESNDHGRLWRPQRETEREKSGPAEKESSRCMAREREARHGSAVSVPHAPRRSRKKEMRGHTTGGVKLNQAKLKRGAIRITSPLVGGPSVSGPH